jgi:hypothetical protein
MARRAKIEPDPWQAQLLHSTAWQVMLNITRQGGKSTTTALVALYELLLRLENGNRVVALPSKEANIRGFSGVTLLIEDEASRVPDPLYQAIRPMLAVSKGRLMLLSTPWGKRGHFFEAWENGGPEWERYEVPATLCPRISPEFLAYEKAHTPPLVYNQEFMCQFSETEDSVFDYDEIQAMFEGAGPMALFG